MRWLVLICVAVAMVGFVLGFSMAPSPMGWIIASVAAGAAVAILCVRHLRKGNDLIAAGLLLWLATYALSAQGAFLGLPKEPYPAGVGGGIGFVAVGMILVSLPPTFAMWMRAAGFIGGAAYLLLMFLSLTGQGSGAAANAAVTVGGTVEFVLLVVWGWQASREA